MTVWLKWAMLYFVVRDGKEATVVGPCADTI